MADDLDQFRDPGTNSSTNGVPPRTPDGHGQAAADGAPNTALLVGIPANHPGTRFLVFFAFLVAITGFIPLPFLDEWVPERLKQLMVRSILRRNSRGYSSSMVAPLWADNSGCFSGCIGFLVLIPFYVIVYPFRKILSIIRAVHGLSRRTVESFLLGHAVARWMALGYLPRNTTQVELERESRLLREAFDRALKECNPTLFTSPLESALRGIRGLFAASLELIRRAAHLARTVRRTAPDVPDAQSNAALDTDPLASIESNGKLPQKSRTALNSAILAFENLLERPEIVEFLRRFEASLDAHVLELRSAEAPPARPPFS